jgi:hypothetical protein
MDWIDMAQGRDRWRAIVTAVKKFQIPYIEENFLTKEYLLASLESIFSIE